MPIKNNFNFNATVHRINQLIGEPSEKLEDRVSMACSPDLKKIIESRANKKSHYLRLAVDLLESFIDHDGQLTSEDITTIELLMSNAQDVIEYAHGAQKSYIETIKSRFQG